MLAKVILLKKSWKTVASAANYVVDDLKKTPEQPDPGHDARRMPSITWRVRVCWKPPPSTWKDSTPLTRTIVVKSSS
jgi:hypothetical protein